MISRGEEMLERFAHEAREQFMRHNFFEHCGNYEWRVKVFNSSVENRVENAPRKSKHPGKTMVSCSLHYLCAGLRLSETFFP
jgi:hypothetical protein